MNNGGLKKNKNKWIPFIMIFIIIAVSCIFFFQFITGFDFEKMEHNFSDRMIKVFNDFECESAEMVNESDYAGMVFNENYHQNTVLFYDISKEESIIGFVLKDKTILVVPQILIAAQSLKIWMIADLCISPLWKLVYFITELF